MQASPSVQPRELDSSIRELAKAQLAIKTTQEQLARRWREPSYSRSASLRRQCHGTDCCSGSSAVSSRMSYLHPALFPSPHPSAYPLPGTRALIEQRTHCGFRASARSRSRLYYCSNFVFIFSCEGGTGCFMIQDADDRTLPFRS